jgi:ABC-type dipeptide/oligopeptide/nickel transport system permease component
MVSRILIPLGAVLLFFGVFTMNSAKVTKDYLETDAVITKAELQETPGEDKNKNPEELYDITVKYTVDGQEYEEYFGVLSGHKEGDRIKILYNPEDPALISQPGNGPVTALIFFIAGAATLAGGIVSAVKAVKKNNAMKAQEEGWRNGN